MLLRSALVLVALVAISSTAAAQLVGVTVLNNSPDPALATADIYIEQEGTEQKGEDIAYQKASNLQSIFIFSELNTRIRIAPGSSTSSDQKVVEKSFTPAFGAAYMIVISGVGTPSEWAANPDGKSTAYTITIFETPAYTGTPNEIGTLVFHGSTDQNASDVRVRGRQNPVFGAAKFGDFTPALVNLPREASVFDLTAPGKANEVYASFEVNLASYSSEVVVLALSGFKTPEENNNGSALVLLAVLESGAVVRNELITGSQTAAVQLIHNAADPLAGLVDVYVNGALSADNLGFRKATPFRDVAAGEPLTIAIAPPTSKGPEEAISTVELPALRPGRSYHLIATGVIDTATFAKNPQERNTIVMVTLIEGAQAQSATDGKTEVRIAHGATDAGELRIRSAKGVNYISGQFYGDITPTYLAVEPETDTLWLIDPETDKPVRGWVANLSGAKRATVLMASGFVDPAANNNGERFRLILVDASGNVSANLAEVEPPTNTSVEELVLHGLTVYPNPSSEQFTIGLPSEGPAVTVDRVVLIDALGQTTSFSVSSASGQIAVPVSGLAPGAYTLRMFSGVQTIIGPRIVVQR